MEEERPIAKGSANRGLDRQGAAKREKARSNPQREVRVRMNIYDLKSVNTQSHEVSRRPGVREVVGEGQGECVCGGWGGGQAVSVRGQATK